MLRLTIFTIFTILTISLAGCMPPPQGITRHPELRVPVTPPLPKFTRAMIDCGNDALVYALCIRIKEREITLKDHIETIQLIIRVHNQTLGEQHED